MILEFDKHKSKSYKMLVETTGVDVDKLNITFNISANGIKYGFPCTIVEDKVQIDVPVLGDVINNLSPGEYQATLDITSNNKYFIQPFNEKIKIMEEPSIKIDKGSLKEDELSVVISELIDGVDVEIDKKTITKPENIDDIDEKSINKKLKNEGNTSSLKKMFDGIDE